MEETTFLKGVTQRAPAHPVKEFIHCVEIFRDRSG